MKNYPRVENPSEETPALPKNVGIHQKKKNTIPKHVT